MSIVMKKDIDEPEIQWIGPIDLCPFYAGDYCGNPDNEEGLCWDSDYKKCEHFIKSQNSDTKRMKEK